MGRHALGGWVIRARELAVCRDAAAKTSGVDPIAVVVDRCGVTRQAALRVLAAYDAVAPHLERLTVTGSLGTIETWRLLAAVDPRQAKAIEDVVLTGTLPLSAVKDILADARAARAAPAAVATMSQDDIAKIVNARFRTVGWQDPSGIAERIPVDLEYSDAVEGPEDSQPFLVPNRALLISPTIACSTSRGRQSATFALSLLAAAGMYRSVIVACSSPVEEEQLTEQLSECRLRPGHVQMIVIARERGGERADAD